MQEVEDDRIEDLSSRWQGLDDSLLILLASIILSDRLSTFPLILFDKFLKFLIYSFQFIIHPLQNINLILLIILSSLGILLYLLNFVFKLCNSIFFFIK